jgi:hypothetical protein
MPIAPAESAPNPASERPAGDRPAAERPVFADAGGRRRRALQAAGATAAVCATAWLAALVLGVVGLDPLPGMTLPGESGAGTRSNAAAGMTESSADRVRSTAAGRESPVPAPAGRQGDSSRQAVRPEPSRGLQRRATAGGERRTSRSEPAVEAGSPAPPSGTTTVPAASPAPAPAATPPTSAAPESPGDRRSPTAATGGSSGAAAPATAGRPESPGRSADAPGRTR